MCTAVTLILYIITDCFRLFFLQGDGSWFSIELPEAEVMSGVKIWFEDSNERQASFSTVCVGEGEVREIDMR